MKRPTHIILLILLAFASLCGCTKAPEKTATCDMKQVVQACLANSGNQTAAFQQSFAQEMAAKQAEARKLQQSIMAERDPAKRQALQTQLQQLTSEIRADQMKAQTDFRQRGTMMSGAFKAAKEAVAQVAKDKGYARVFDSSGIAMVYTDGSEDITPDVLKAVSAVNPTEPTPSPTPGVSPGK